MICRLCLLIAALCVGVAAHADYDKGMAAMRANNYDEALKEFQAAAERGDPRAMEALGFMHSNGRGVEKDMHMAVLYWKLAAMQGVARAQYMVGLAYGSGNGIAKDEGLAKEWLRKSARRDYEPAKKALAEYYPDVSLEPATGPWLEVRKRDGLLVFSGQVEGTRWAFVIPGSDIKQAEGQPVMMVDGLLLQIRPVSRKAFESEPGPMLDAHRGWEQKYQRESFPDASIAPNAMCKGAITGYREWKATFAGNKNYKEQVYMTFEVGPTSVMMMNSAYTNDEEKKKVEDLVANICRTWKTDW
jgi:hypothetical protein